MKMLGDVFVCLVFLLSLQLVRGGGRLLTTYVGVTDVVYRDTDVNYGRLAGNVTWKPPADLTGVENYRVWMSASEDSVVSDRSTGKDLWDQPSWNIQVSRGTNVLQIFPHTMRFINGASWLESDPPARYLQVYTKINNRWQARQDLAPSAVIPLYDLGWTDPMTLPFQKEDVLFVDTDFREGYIGGVIQFAMLPFTDFTYLGHFQVFFCEDSEGRNPTWVQTLPMAESFSLPLPADFLRGNLTAIRIVGINDGHGTTVNATVPIFDDTGKPPDIQFSFTFVDEDPQADLIGGKLVVHIPFYDMAGYTSLVVYLAQDANGLYKQQLDTMYQFQDTLVIPKGTRLGPRDTLVIYPESIRGRQEVPASLAIQDLIVLPIPPGASSRVDSIEFQDENFAPDKVSGTVRWVSGSAATPTTHYLVFFAVDAQGTDRMQVGNNVSKGFDELVLNDVDVSAAAYKFLLVIAANQWGVSEFFSAVPLQNAMVSCQTSPISPCALHEVFKEVQEMPVACSTGVCSAEECCADAGTCDDFFAGNDTDGNATGCETGYVPKASPPQYCAGVLCKSADCCLLKMSDQPVSPAADPSSSSPNSIQVHWEVPDFNDCTFTGYEVQVQNEGGNSSWQEVDGCKKLNQACTSSCNATGLTSNTQMRFRVRSSCLIIGAAPGYQWQTTPWSISDILSTLPTRPQAPQNPVLSTQTESEVDISWTSGDMGEDCIFKDWVVQLRDNSLPQGMAPWTDFPSCAGVVRKCSVMGLQCNTSYSLRVAATCADPQLRGVWREIDFRTLHVDSCLNHAAAPLSVDASAPTTSSINVEWTPGPPHDCTFRAWEVQKRPANSATWSLTQNCSPQVREETSCTVTGLLSLTQHQFRVRELCTLNSTISPWSAASPFVSTLVRPSLAPTGLTVSSISYDSVSLEWEQPMLNDCVFARYLVQWTRVPEDLENDSKQSSASAAWLEPPSGSCAGSTQDLSSTCTSGCSAKGLPPAAKLAFRVAVECTLPTASSPWSSETVDSAALVSTQLRSMTIPSNLSITSITSSTARVAWQAGELHDCDFEGWLLELRAIPDSS
eukprot:TRINITY_DN14079_c0_g1_i1.p1 TRINITY_DN14079_c0_g1~~TRINITY_DN14079_c0_g1_i1.p1  ORF type:complete len:1066 (-),score=156.42 TRINITY_DN14079_c0_g1_i1:44-3241(-)